MQISNVFSALAGAERVFAVMDEEPEPVDDGDAAVLNPMKGYVELKDVTFGYNPEKTILKDISLYAKPGQKIAFVGSTGAGKTTITNLLNRFYDIQSGSITIDGVNIRHINRDNLRQNIAMVLQDTHLFTGTVMENIRYGRLDATDEEVIPVSYTHLDVYKRQAMHSYNNAYCSKLFRLLKMSDINFVSNPLVNTHLQGRFDSYPRRRGVTRVKELLANGNNVSMGHDDIFDPWYPLGDGNMMSVVHMGLHVCQMMGYEEILNSYRPVSYTHLDVYKRQIQSGG